MKLTRKLLLLPVLLSSLALAAPPEAPPKSALPPVDQIQQDLLQSRRGFGLTLQNARYYAGWIPRGFVTAMLRYRPQILPGQALTEQQWKDGPWFRDGMSYRAGITDWGAQFMANRQDQHDALTQANWDFTGTARIGFGRFLGFAFDPALIALLVLLFSGLRGLFSRRRQRRQELAMMRRDQHLRGEYPPYQPQPPQPPPEFPEPEDAATDQVPPRSAEPEHLTDPQPLMAPISAYAAGSEQLTGNSRTITAGAGAHPVEHPAHAVDDSPTVPEAAPTPQQNSFTAFQACQTRAEAGSAEDQFQLATMFRRGVGVEASPRQARHWFQCAAEQSHPQAQYQLARLLFHGIGALPDEHAAAVWMEQAAQQGLTDAKRDLATLYARGRGVAANNDTARYWLTQAAEEHDADAAELMASASEQGWLGMPADSEAAAAWRATAAANGD